jgi:dTDP-4-amino-4,6-dideoxygalactose transaminase
MIRLAMPSIEDDDLQAVSEVLKTGYLVQGKNVAEFEEKVASYVGASYAVAVSNCTAALYLSLLALDVQVSDFVIVPAYSWPATANVVECCKAQPVFIDIEPDTYNMDPNCLEERLRMMMSVDSIRKRVKAIIPVHIFGQMANMDIISGLAQQYEIPIIEDAACALGARWNDKMAGTWGIMGCFSFHPRKAITTGEGGLITTNDAKIAEKLRSLRNHGLRSTSLDPDFILPGLNMRITEFQAALERCK